MVRPLTARVARVKWAAHLHRQLRQSLLQIAGRKRAALVAFWPTDPEDVPNWLAESKRTHLLLQPRPVHVPVKQWPKVGALIAGSIVPKLEKREPRQRLLVVETQAV